MSRYSSGNSVLRVTTYLAPLGPLAILSALYSSTSDVVDLPTFVALWLLGLLISYLLIAVHEAGHALAGWLARLKIDSIMIGHWRRLFTFRIGDVRVMVRAAPAGGHVAFENSMELHSVFRFSVVLLAGVGAQAVLMLAVFIVRGPEEIESFTELLVAFTRLSILWLGGFHVVMNLLPREYSEVGATHRTDGLQLLLLWRNRQQLPAARRAAAEWLKVNELVAGGKSAEALALATRLAADQPEHRELQTYVASLHAKNGDTRSAEAILRGLVADGAGSPGNLVAALDGLCCLPIYHGRRDLLAEADAWSNEALRQSPHAITLKGTRGSILIEFGRWDEGIALLREVVSKSDCVLDQAISAAYLAKARAAQGDMAEAKRQIDRAVAINPGHIVVKRIASELGAAFPPTLEKAARS